jgi:hypothetical protein
MRLVVFTLFKAVETERKILSQGFIKGSFEDQLKLNQTPSPKYVKTPQNYDKYGFRLINVYLLMYLKLEISSFFNSLCFLIFKCHLRMFPNH